MVLYCGQPPLQVPLHKLNSRAQLNRQAPVVQRLSQFANMFSQFWQQVGIIAIAEAGVGFARRTAVKTSAKRMHIRSNGRM
jgi:hypothetical protein